MSHFLGWRAEGGKGLFEGTFNVVLDWGPEQTWFHVPPAFHTTDALPLVCNDAIVPILSAALCQLHRCHDDAPFCET